MNNLIYLTLIFILSYKLESLIIIIKKCKPTNIILHNEQFITAIISYENKTKIDLIIIIFDLLK